MALGEVARPAPYRKLSLEVQSFYSELLAVLRVADLSRSIADLEGRFITRYRGGSGYHYFRTSAGGSGRREFYVGPDDEATRKLMGDYEAQREVAEVREARINRLTRMIRGGDMPLTEPQSGRIIHGLAEAGIFQQGGVLVGTQGFRAIGNALGVEWSYGVSTKDVDFGNVRTLDLGIMEGSPMSSDIPAAIDALKMGFIPALRLHSTTKATTYVVKGQDWRIDLLTEARGRREPVLLPRLNAYAQPLEFMSYLLEKTMPAVVISTTATHVTVPKPARFALHKLLVASNREAHEHTHAAKDRDQAYQLLCLLEDERPGDIRDAAEDLVSQGPSWVRRLRGQLKLLPREFNELSGI